MKRLLLLLLAVSGLPAFGRQAVQEDMIVERVDVSGISDTRLSPELRGDIQKLTGQVYDPEIARQLAEGIQIELPEYVAAPATQPGTQPDAIRLIFVVARISDDEALSTNINSRYIVDAVEVEGDFREKISDELNAELQKMVGQNLDSELAGRLADRILKEVDELGVSIDWKLRRGSAPQRVRIVYGLSVQWSTFNVYVRGVTYHSRQGFSVPGAGIRYGRRGIGKFGVQILNDADPLIERNAGLSYQYNADRDRLHFSMSFSSYRAQWKEATLRADEVSPRSPGLYRLRDAFAVKGGVDITRRLRADAGVSLGVLQMQSPPVGFRKDRVLEGSLRASLGREADSQGPSHYGSLFYQIQSGTGALDSDLVYTRHYAFAGYGHTHDDHEVRLSFLAGKITGNAPMHQRFSLGNSSTLRGWSKYELSPLGGNRVAHFSAAYKYDGVGVFYDTGSIWDAGQTAVVRHSAGFGIDWSACTPDVAGPNERCFYSLSVGFPIDGGSGAVVTVGFRF